VIWGKVRPTFLNSIVSQKGFDTMIEKIWKNLLDSDEYEKPLVTKEEVRDVVSLMIEVKIDPKKFGGNLHAILTGGMPSLFDFTNDEQRLPTTNSISHFTSIVNRPLNAPLWLLAGFPDVMNWLHERQKDILNPSISEDDRIKKTAILFGIDIEDDKDITESDLFNEEGQYRTRYYRNLIDNYKNDTGKNLETAVEEGSPNDIYLGMNFMNILGEKSNFTLIANMTTKYYLELKRNFSHRLSDETSLISVAGILDANVYIFGTQQIKPQQIIAIAQGTKNSKDRLLDFIILFESLLLSVDTPDLSYEEVKNACEDQSKVIKSAIEQTISSYTSDSKISNDVRIFMKSSQFSRIRKVAGGRSDSILDKIKKIFTKKGGGK